MTDFIEEKWKKEFVDNFIADNILDCIPKENWEEMKGEIFGFISELLSDQKAAILKEVEENLPKEKHTKTPNYKWIIAERDGYNQALKEVKEVLEKIK